jgi:hypothetical protein
VSQITSIGGMCDGVAVRISGSLIERPRSVTAQTPRAEFSSAPMPLRWVRAQ